MDHPFQLPREFHTDLMSPSILSAIKQRSRCDAPSSTTLIHKDEPSPSPIPNNDRAGALQAKECGCSNNARIVTGGPSQPKSERMNGAPLPSPHTQADLSRSLVAKRYEKDPLFPQPRSEREGVVGWDGTGRDGRDVSLMSNNKDNISDGRPLFIAVAV